MGIMGLGRWTKGSQGGAQERRWMHTTSRYGRTVALDHGTREGSWHVGMPSTSIRWSISRVDSALPAPFGFGVPPRQLLPFVWACMTNK